MYTRRKSLGTRLANFIWKLLILAVCLWPAWLWLALRAMLNPEGFWQKLVMVGLGLWFLGIIQIVFLVIALYLILKD
jgi:hypothetical protein